MCSSDLLQHAAARAAFLQTRKGSMQSQVPGADHFFRGHEDELVRWVKRFLDRALR